MVVFGIDMSRCLIRRAAAVWLAAMLAAEMSTDSGYMLTWATVIYNDIIKPCLRHPLTPRGELVLTRAFSVAKRVRSETEIGQSAVSISYAAVELAREIFGCNLQVLGLDTALQTVKLRHFECGVGKIDAGHAPSALNHAFGEDTAAAADIDHTLAFEWNKPIDPVQAQRVDLVQGAEFAFRVPPLVGQVGKLREFLGVGVDHGRHATE